MSCSPWCACPNTVIAAAGTQIGRAVLGQQLVHMGVLADPQALMNEPAFLSRFNNVWADNADAISLQYAGMPRMHQYLPLFVVSAAAGTPALKTDYTRTGKRTLSGALADLTKSATRFFKNNVTDAALQVPIATHATTAHARQDGYDLLLANFIVASDKAVPYQRSLAHRLVGMQPSAAAPLTHCSCHCACWPRWRSARWR